MTITKVCSQRWKEAKSLTLLLMQHILQSITQTMLPLLFSWNTSSSFAKDITSFTISIGSFTMCNISITALAAHNTFTNQVNPHLPLLSTNENTFVF